MAQRWLILTIKQLRANDISDHGIKSYHPFLITTIAIDNFYSIVLHF